MEYLSKRVLYFYVTLILQLDAVYLHFSVSKACGRDQRYRRRSSSSKLCKHLFDAVLPLSKLSCPLPLHNNCNPASQYKVRSSSSTRLSAAQRADPEFRERPNPARLFLLRGCLHSNRANCVNGNKLCRFPSLILLVIVCKGLCA